MIADLASLADLGREGLAVLFVVFLRVGAAMAVLPAFGERSIPERVRLVLALAFTAIVAPAVAEVVLPSLSDGRSLVPVLAGEVVAGLALGLGLRLFVLGGSSAYGFPWGARESFTHVLGQVLAAEEPPFEYGIICCAMRMFTGAFSQYYATLFAAHPYARAKELYSMASIELARAAVAARDGYGLQVVGFDLAGEEAGYPAGDHKQAYDYAHRHFLKKTVHAGEAYGPESIFQAITDLHADRIGHGTYLLEPDAIRDEEIGDREHYVERLGNYIADRRITLEVCLTSNLQTNPQLRRLEEHAFSKLRAQRLSTTICTDNRLVSGTTMTNEYRLAVEHYGLSEDQVLGLVMNGFKSAFLPLKQKSQLVDQVLSEFASLGASFSGEISRRRRSQI